MTAKNVDPFRPPEEPQIASVGGSGAGRESRLGQGSTPTGAVAEVPPRLDRFVGMTSIVFGLLGGLFYWWTPLGIVLSLTGLIMGFVAWVSSAPGSWNRRLAIGGVFLSAATLVLGLIITLMGLELIQFGPLR